MGSEEQAFFLSDAAFQEFQRQDVFGSLEEFVEAMPPATRGVHLIPVELVQPAPTTASAEDLFGWLTFVHTTPDREDPTIEDESIFRVDDANDLLKDQEGGYKMSPMSPDQHQDMRDEGLQDISLIELPYDRETFPVYEQTGHRPGDFDDYARNNFYRDFHEEEMSRNAVRIPVDVFIVEGRVAKVWSEIVDRLNPSVISKAGDCKVKLVRSQPKHARWAFHVSDPDGSGKTHTVYLKAERRGSAVDLNKVDLRVACSCEFWKWQGPDYHAASEGYLDRQKRSDGSAPTIRDPDNVNRVCKHVYAASSLFMKYKLERRKKSSRIRKASMGTFEIDVIQASTSLDVRKEAILAEMRSTKDMARSMSELAAKIHKQTG